MECAKLHPTMEAKANTNQRSKMAYITCGAYVDGIRPATKKILRGAIANAPETVVFDSTELMRQGYLYTVQHTLQSSDVIQVCGPDPYTSRKWYASIRAGKLT